MHKFLRAIGFSKFKKKDLELVIKQMVEHPEVMRVTRDTEGNEFAELAKFFGPNIGLMVRGTYNEKEEFELDYYVPFVGGNVITSEESVHIEKFAERQEFAGICDEMRVGVALIFYLQNAADFLSEYRDDIERADLHGVIISALSVDGKIILPVEQKTREKVKTPSGTKSRSQLLAEARDGNEEAIEQLTMEDMDTYSDISRRIGKEDILSIVSSSIMPYGMESDQYSIIGEILEVEEIHNSLTNENLYYMKIECSDIIFNITINQEDLLGEPMVGRRFKGSVWLQGTVCL